MTFESYEVVAHNTATRSQNKIHDDHVARRYGFRGGLVPGVDVYAYLTHVPAAAWGLAWLERGWMEARFVQPVYEGERVVVDAQPPTNATPDAVDLVVRGPDGGVRAEGRAALPATSPPLPETAGWPRVAARDPVPAAAPDALQTGAVLALDAHRFDAARASEYLSDVRETLDLYEREGVAHPGWLLRDANHVLARNVRLGPWIHVESSVQHHALVHDGDDVATRAVVRREWERRGHRFVQLDVAIFARERLVARIDHTAIYEPRAAANATSTSPASHTETSGVTEA